VFAVFIESKNKKEKELFYDAVFYFVKERLDHIKRLDLTIVFGTKKEIQCAGYCSQFDGKYEIGLARTTSTKMLLTLFHELTHLQQFLDGRLKPDVYPATIWNGKSFFRNVKTIKEYRALPWEVEANTQMKILYNDFSNSKNEELIL
jgi:hypothetical protein